MSVESQVYPRVGRSNQRITDSDESGMSSTYRVFRTSQIIDQEISFSIDWRLDDVFLEYVYFLSFWVIYLSVFSKKISFSFYVGQLFYLLQVKVKVYLSERNRIV